jgi:hypothetical protein
MVHNPPGSNIAASDEAARRRRGRSWAILIALFGLCLLFYAIAIVKMAHPQ